MDHLHTGRNNLRPAYDDIVAELRPRLGRSDEGSLWAVFLDRTDVLFVAAVEGGVRPRDTAFCGNLLRVLDGSGARDVLLVVPRRDGHVLADDRDLWQRLRTGSAALRLRLHDLLVVGDRSWTCLRREPREPSAARMT